MKLDCRWGVSGGPAGVATILVRRTTTVRPLKVVIPPGSNTPPTSNNPSFWNQANANPCRVESSRHSGQLTERAHVLALVPVPRARVISKRHRPHSELPRRVPAEIPQVYNNPFHLVNSIPTSPASRPFESLTPRFNSSNPHRARSQRVLHLPPPT